MFVCPKTSFSLKMLAFMFVKLWKQVQVHFSKQLYMTCEHNKSWPTDTMITVTIVIIIVSRTLIGFCLL